MLFKYFQQYLNEARVNVHCMNSWILVSQGFLSGFFSFSVIYYTYFWLIVMLIHLILYIIFVAANFEIFLSPLYGLYSCLRFTSEVYFIHSPPRTSFNVWKIRIGISINEKYFLSLIFSLIFLFLLSLLQIPINACYELLKKCNFRKL